MKNAAELLEKASAQLGRLKKISRIYECMFLNAYTWKVNLRQISTCNLSTTFSMMPSFISKTNTLRRFGLVSNFFDRNLTQLDQCRLDSGSIEEQALHHFSEDRRINGLSQVYAEREDVTDRIIELLIKVNNRLRKEWRGYEVSLVAECKISDHAYLNSNELAAAYERVQWGLHYYLSHPKKRIEKRGFLSDCSVYDDFVARTDRSVNRYQDPRALGKETYIQGGKSSVILSPSVVAILCGIISHYNKVGEICPEGVSKAIPKKFELREDPMVHGGSGGNGILFDHEGVKTSSKVLCEGKGGQSEKMTDLNAASLMGEKLSTGNGFRRGLFTTEMADNSPSIHPSFLTLSPGSLSFDQLIQEHDDLILIDSIYLPTDRVADLVKGEPMIVIRGDYYKKGQFVSRIFSQNYARRPLISCYPKVYGSLLDPSAQMLREGEHIRDGWYPYIYLPVLTWAKN